MPLVEDNSWIALLDKKNQPDFLGIIITQNIHAFLQTLLQEKAQSKFLLDIKSEKECLL